MIRVLGDRVLVALPPADDNQLVTASGLVLVKDPDRAHRPTRGIVMQLGEKIGTVDIDDARAAVHAYFLEHDPDLRASMRYIGDDVDRVLMKLAPAGFDVQLGDCIIFPLNAGDYFEQDGISYVVLQEDDIIGIVEPKDEAA